MNIDLRPLNLSEILDRTFQLYRARFPLFLGIAAVSSILELVWNVCQLGLTAWLTRSHLGLAQPAISTATSIVGSAFGFACAALAIAAINRAVLAIYESESVSISAAYRALRDRWLTCVWINILGFFIAWSPVILIAFVLVFVILYARSAQSLTQANAVTLAYGSAGLFAFVTVPLCIWLTLRYSLAICACVQERVGTLASLKRSVVLSRQSRGSIFMLMLVVGAAWMIVLIVFMAPTFGFLLKGRGHTTPAVTIYTVAVAFVCSTLIKPIYAIGLTLFYYDARIRKEGYDVEWLLEHSTQTPFPPQTLTGPAPASSGVIAE